MWADSSNHHFLYLQIGWHISFSVTFSTFIKNRWMQRPGHVLTAATWSVSPKSGDAQLPLKIGRAQKAKGLSADHPFFRGELLVLGSVWESYEFLIINSSFMPYESSSSRASSLSETSSEGITFSICQSKMCFLQGTNIYASLDKPERVTQPASAQGSLHHELTHILHAIYQVHQNTLAIFTLVTHYHRLPSLKLT